MTPNLVAGFCQAGLNRFGLPALLTATLAASEVNNRCRSPVTFLLVSVWNMCELAELTPVIAELLENRGPGKTT